MARDCIALMRSLGHDRFAVVGHDRGCYVAQRLALEHPEAVTQLAVLDGVPIGDALACCDARFAEAWWHWFFLGQTAKPAERVISVDPDAWYRVGPSAMGEEAYADLRKALHDPEVVQAMCEDYRAGLGIDRVLDGADRAAGRRIQCPVLVVWRFKTTWASCTEIWREWADDVDGVTIDSGHHMAEEAPEELAAAIQSLLSRSGSARS